MSPISFFSMNRHCTVAETAAPPRLASAMLLLTTPVAMTIRQVATWWLGSTVWSDRKDAQDVASSAQVRASGLR